MERPASKGKAARFNEIVSILVENDFWGMLRQLLRGDLSERDGVSVPRRVRLMLEQLGPTFIKIGQLLATRPDLVPQEFAEEFKHLYDGTSPSPGGEVRAVIKEELGRDVDTLFSSFDETALASASVGQVHKATLADGTDVAVKIQHIGIDAPGFPDSERARHLHRKNVCHQPSTPANSSPC